MKMIVPLIVCLFLFQPLFPSAVGARDCAEIRAGLSAQKAKVNKLKAELKDAGFFTKSKLQKQLKTASKEMTRLQKEWLANKCGRKDQIKKEPLKRPAVDPKMLKRPDPDPKKPKEPVPEPKIPKEKPLGEPA